MFGKRSQIFAAMAFWTLATCVRGQLPPFSPAPPDPTSAAGVAPVSVPSLEVISVKPNKSVGGGMSLGYPPDGVAGTNIPVHMMLTEAFHLNDNQLINEPEWAKTEHFDISGKVSGADAAVLRKLKPDQKRVFFQQVLKERFGLVVHNETRELPEFALVVAKGGAKIEDGKPDTSAPADKRMSGGIRTSMNGGVKKVEWGGMPIDMLTQVLSNETGRTVVNKTGLAGKYNFTLTWSPAMKAPMDGAQAGEAPLPSDATPDLFTAIQEQLGLKLEPIKGPVDVLVIDHLERPGEN